MKSKFVILFLILSFAVLIGGCVNQPKTTSGDYVMNAPQVFSSDGAITSEQDAKNLLISNSDKIIEGTLNLYNQYPDLIKNPRYSSFKAILNAAGNNWQFVDSEVKLRGCCAGYFWTGDNSEKYVITILSSTTGTKEMITCNDPAEQPATNERTGETNCGSGIKERKMVNINSRLMYIIDDSGKVYFAGAYPNQN